MALCGSELSQGFSSLQWSQACFFFDREICSKLLGGRPLDSGQSKVFPLWQTDGKLNRCYQQRMVQKFWECSGPVKIILQRIISVVWWTNFLSEIWRSQSHEDEARDLTLSMIRRSSSVPAQTFSQMIAWILLTRIQRSWIWSEWLSRGLAPFLPN